MVFVGQKSYNMFYKDLIIIILFYKNVVELFLLYFDPFQIYKNRINTYNNINLSNL